MPLALTAKAVEKSTYTITISFADEDGVAIAPLTLTWKLTDALGNVINSRSAVSVTPAASVVIVLSGDDLQIGTTGRGRVLTIQGTYDSTIGLGLPLKDEITFEVVDLKAVS